jgi:hypothetical protein
MIVQSRRGLYLWYSLIRDPKPFLVCEDVDEQDPRLRQPLRWAFPLQDRHVGLLALLCAQSHHVSLYRNLRGRRNPPSARRRYRGDRSESANPFKFTEVGHSG